MSEILAVRTTKAYFRFRVDSGFPCMPTSVTVPHLCHIALAYLIIWGAAVCNRGCPV